MSDPGARRFPFWLTVSVLSNLVLAGMVAGIFLNSPAKPGWSRSGSGQPAVIALSDEDRAGVRRLMRSSFEAGREALGARRAGERRLADALRAEPYDETGVRQALAALREADRIARDKVADHMIDGLDELNPDQRAMVARALSGSLERRSREGERLETFRERQRERRNEDAGPANP